MSESALLIAAALVVVVLIVMILRARRRSDSPAGRHVDTSVTAVGAATEAVRNVVEEVIETIEDTRKSDAAPSPTPSPTPTAATPEKIAATPRKAAAAPAKTAAAAPAKKAAAAPAKAAKPSSVAVTAIGIPAAVGAPDDLRLIKGLGPKLNTVLADLGILRYDQIAAWKAADIAKVDDHLGTFKGRIVRDSWIEQAKLLAKGDTAGFEAKFGKLDKPSKA